ncbi:MAG: fimbrillin family protein [Bacteroides sp.]|nr:fimbrillin family protein [Bacteroides sp.]
MKKILFLAMAAAAMVSCSQNEEFENAGQKAEIKFGTVVKSGTRAVITTDANFTEFVVNAYRTTGDMADATALSEEFMPATTVTKTGKVWGYTETYYWPLTDKIQFFATAPGQTLATEGTKFPKFDYTIKGVAEQEDLIAANVIDKSKTSDAITFPFRHLLTQVNFTIKGATSEYTYTVSKLVIKGAKDKGTFTFDGTENVGAWTALTASEPAPEHLYEGEVSVAPTAESPNEEKAFETDGNALFMLMPQDLSNVTLDITYAVAKTTTPNDYIYNDTKTVNLTGAWGMAQNIRYTLVLTNDASPVTFGTHTIGGWADAVGTGDAPVTTPANK